MIRNKSLSLLLTLVLCLCVIPAMGQKGPSVSSKPVVINAVRHDVSPPFRDIPSVPLPLGAMREFDEDAHHGPQAPIRTTLVQDTAVQQTFQPLIAAANGLSFEGIGQGFTGFTLTGAPPDINGAVGATQYVQTVNTALAIFDKSTGALLKGAETFNTLFSGFGGPCQNDGGSDPVVLYDKMANRWLISILITTSGQHSECLAISTTSDATGTYNRYEMAFGSVLNDFPKWAVWPDAYYMTGNQFQDVGGFIGRQVCAVNRSAALNGQPLQMVCLPFSASGAALPSDMDGATPPAAGTPNFIFALGGNGASLIMFKFHVDFTTTANSTLTGPTTIPVAAFNELCPGSNCVPQAGTTQLLSSIGDVPNHRVAYRNFGDHESIVLNHSVSVNSVAGVRWYEIRSPNGTPTVFQQGTFQPDSNWRWMGSVATDKSGDIAAGYSESSSAIHPEIAVTGRTPSDPPGALETENVVFSGGGSQTTTLSRWGDYSAMTVDPTDDCTFFYTTEYIPVNGTFNWHTRIVSFKMNNCGAVADFTLSASPNSLSITQGSSGTSTITVNPVNGFTGSVSLSASGLPAGVTAAFNPSSTTGSSTLTLTASSTASTGTATVTITGVSGSLTRTTSISVTVNPAVNGGPVPVNLSGAFNINSGIVVDGTTFSSGGLDGGGNSYSSNLLGSSVTFGGTQLTFGPANALDAVANATVTLPSGRFSSLKVLAAGVNGNQASQTFTVHFSDGTSQSFTQSISDWAHPQNFAGETIVSTMTYRDQSTGVMQTRTVNLFGYVLTLNSTKTVSSITLPATRNVVVLAMSLIPAAGGGTQAQANLGGAFNREGIVTDGTTFTGGLDGGGSAYSANLLGSTVSFGGATFNLGAANTSNDVSATGQTITLPSGQFSSLRMLATGVDGNQASQSFVVHFSDGTSSTFAQNLSDWFTPQSFAGESTAVTMAYRDSSSGGKDSRTFLLYGYSFALNNTKTVSSITLPNNANVEVLAITLVP